MLITIRVARGRRPRQELGHTKLKGHIDFCLYYKDISKSFKPRYDLITFVFQKHYSDCPERTLLGNFKTAYGLTYLLRVSRKA